MRKINIQIRFAIVIGLLVALFSFVTMFFTVENVNYAANVAKDNLMQNIDIAYEASLDDENDMAYGQNTQDNLSVKESRVGFEFDKTQIKNSAYYNAIDILASSQKELIAHQISFSILLGILGMIIAYPISGFMLKPFKDLASDIESINANNLKNELKIDNPNDEIGVIKKSVNQMLHRLDESFQRQKRFASNVSHELKTPLTVMKTYGQILDESSTLDEYQEVNAVQLKNIDRMITLVDDFMMFSEEEILINDHIDVKECLEAVIDDLKPLMDKKKLELDVKVNDLYIMSNKSLFSRLLYNLINNAIKYNKDNGKIYITLEDMRLSIRDTGIGIDDEHIKHIFEPLYCVDKSRSRELGGSGLGLAIVRNICKTLGYKVEVYSKIGYGTEFVIKL